MKLYNRKSYINSAPEGQAQPSKKSKITQWLYLLLLLLMISYIIYLVVKPYFVISTNGIVDVENKYVYSDRAGLVKEVQVNINTQFSQGELLAVISPEKSCNETIDSRIEKLIYDIDVLKGQQQALIKEKDYLDVSKTAVRKPMQRALEINSALFIEQDKLQLEQDKKSATLQFEIEQKQSQIKAINIRLGKLKVENQAASLDSTCLDKPIYAFREGYVTAVNIEPATYIKKGDALITYREQEPSVSVVMLADIELYQDLIKQPTLTVTFPDQTESYAKIQQVESAASHSTLTINEILSSKQTSLRVVLTPADQNERAKWRKYERMSVLVKGVR